MSHSAAPAMLVLRTERTPVELRTPRTLLRLWRDSDLAPWVAMNADPTVRRWFPSVCTEAEALGEAGRIREQLGRRGWGVWALEIPGRIPFAGFVGLHVVGFEAPFVPAVEMGWRLAPEAWGQGYATEAAQACARYAFEHLQLDELVAYTAAGNLPSRRVMDRLGMQHDERDDFDHPLLEADHPLRRHVLYRLRSAPPVPHDATTPS